MAYKWPESVWHYAHMVNASVDGLTISSPELDETFNTPAELIAFCGYELNEMRESLAAQGEELPPLPKWYKED